MFTTYVGITVLAASAIAAAAAFDVARSELVIGQHGHAGHTPGLAVPRWTPSRRPARLASWWASASHSSGSHSRLVGPGEAALPGQASRVANRTTPRNMAVAA
jgi:hypothetical protein